MKTRLQRLINKIRLLFVDKQEILDNLHRIPDYYYITTEDVDKMFEEEEGNDDAWEDVDGTIFFFSYWLRFW